MAYSGKLCFSTRPIFPISLRKASIDSISAPKTVKKALNHPGWKNAMLEEIRALEDNHTWKLVDLPQGKKWMIHQLDIKNAFLHGDLEEEVYMEQPPGFVAQGEYGKEIQEFGMNKSKKDHSVFYKKSTVGIILLVVYVDDIVIIGNDHAGISNLKAFMHSKFHTKDLGELKYFLGIEVSRSKKVMFLSQRKYVLDLLEETSKIEAKPCATPMVPNVQLMPDDGDPFYNPESQFTSAPTVKHWAALEQILCYLKKALGLAILYSGQGHTRIECFSDVDWAGSKFDRRSTTGYCVFFGGNLVAWKSKKQSVVSRSSAESEYRAMAQATCEIIWIHQLLCEVGMKCTMLAKLWCDNQAALHIVANLVYHERTKHIEVDCHFIHEKIEENLVSTGYVKTREQLGDIFTKALNGTRVDYFCNKLGMINIYALA
ncbi:Retrovirus-related Pol polyprotein from transposon RE1 [Vitis vinifera]|uniref:Retrovirus-related Pol polyprotein from transposon RE1 n=1 Tax=Vitis vinifera TaxID=29760 RepID=A0A438CR65_VITVI|nr:Retrovirus-related Pol polyprotein from transposon RE1 [Vitis vinifera]